MKRLMSLMFIFIMTSGLAFAKADYSSFVPEDTCYDVYQEEIDTIAARQAAIFSNAEESEEGIPMNKSLKEAWQEAKAEQEANDGRISAEDMHGGTAALLTAETIGLSVGLIAAVGSPFVILVPIVAAVGTGAIYGTFKLNKVLLQSPYKRMQRLISEAYAFEVGKLNKKRGLFKRMAKKYSKQMELSKEEGTKAFAEIVMALNETPGNCTGEAIVIKDIKYAMQANALVLEDEQD